MNFYQYLYIAILLSLSLLKSGVSCYSYTVLASSEDCFFEDVAAGTKLALAFQVTAGGALDIDARIADPNGAEIYAVSRVDAGQYAFSAPAAGVYQFCFSNVFSTVTAKQVGFSVTVGETAGAASSSQELAKMEHLTLLENSIIQVSEGLASIQSEQAYMRARERGHRSTTENTNSRVLYWAIFEALVLLLMSFGQIFYIKRSFEIKSKV